MSSFVINKQEYIKAGGFFAGLADQRITPACAGKSPKSTAKSLATTDHPRLCGEKQLKLLKKRVIKGSPPLVRGKEGGLKITAGSIRITPACAGKSN